MRPFALGFVRIAALPAAKDVQHPRFDRYCLAVGSPLQVQLYPHSRVIVGKNDGSFACGILGHFRFCAGEDGRLQILEYQG